MKNGLAQMRANPHKIINLCTLSTKLSPSNMVALPISVRFPTLSTILTSSNNLICE